MTDELKPVRCGCGGEVAVLFGVDKGHEYYIVKCWGCGTQTVKKRHKAEAIQTWNTAMGANHFRDLTKMMERTAKVEVVEKPNVFKCSERGQYFHSTSWGSPVAYCSRCGCRLEWE